MSLIQGFYVFTTSFFTALMMVPLLYSWGGGKGILDIPAGRRVHAKAIVRAGGIAIGAAFLFSLMMYVEPGREIRGIIAGGIILFFTGLVDDIYGLSPTRKLTAEIAGCLAAMAVGRLCIQNLGNLFGLGPVILPLWLAVPFTVFVVVGIINAVNLMDGLDGLAGGIAVIALAAFAVHASLAGNSTAVIVCLALLGGVMGFLRYNLYPARIFMGESGSLGVGFVLAFLVVSLTQSPVNPVNPVVPLIILGVPIVDAVWIMSQRLTGQRVRHRPEMNQVFHKIMKLGFRHRFTVLVIYAISLGWAVFSVVFRLGRPALLLAVFAAVSAVFYLGLNYVRDNRACTEFLKKNSWRSIRETELYRRTATRIAGVMPGLVALILLYLVLAATAGSETGPFARQVGAVLAAGCALLLCVTRDTRNHFVLAMFYFSGMLIAFVVEQHSDVSLMPGVSLGRCANILYVAMTLLVAPRILLHRPGEFFLNHIDFLILGITALLLVIDRIGGEIYGTVIMAKGIILYLALKAATHWGRRPRKLILCSMLVVLFILVVRGYCSI